MTQSHAILPDLFGQKAADIIQRSQRHHLSQVFTLLLQEKQLLALYYRKNLINHLLALVSHQQSDLQDIHEHYHAVKTLDQIALDLLNEQTLSEEETETTYLRIELSFSLYQRYGNAVLESVARNLREKDYIAPEILSEIKTKIPIPRSHSVEPDPRQIDIDIVNLKILINDPTQKHSVSEKLCKLLNDAATFEEFKQACKHVAYFKIYLQYAKSPTPFLRHDRTDYWKKVCDVISKNCIEQFEDLPDARKYWEEIEDEIKECLDHGVDLRRTKIHNQ